MKKITMTELAEKAEVSTATLRRYLKNENVRSDIAERIKEAIEKTGFVYEETKAKIVKAAAKTESRSDAKANSYTFAIITKDMTEPRSRKTIKALQTMAHKMNTMISVYACEGNAVLEARYCDLAVASHINALIVEDCADKKGIENRMKNASIPCFFLRNSDYSVDEEEAGVTLGNYLIEKRHLIIRYLGADEALASAHYEGIRKTYHNRKQPLDFDMKMCDGTHLGTYEKIKEIFAEKIDMLILERDEMAIALNKYLKEYHIAVPQNTSVISIGGHAITRVMSPTLTSLAFDYNTYADVIINSVVAQLENKKKPKMPEIYHIQEGDSVR